MNAASAKQLVDSSRDILWFVARGNVLKGPYSTEQLQECIKRKEVSYLDFCWRQGFKEWRPIVAVNALDRRKRMARLPQYPTVEVPGGGTIEAPRKAAASTDATADGVGDTDNKQKENRLLSTLSETLPADRRRKPVEVTFARHKRHNMSIYEWAFAAIFAVGFAYFVSMFALQEVSENFLRRMFFLSFGNVRVVGEATEAVVPEAWDPLYSAPGFVEAAHDGRVEMPVRIVGAPIESGDRTSINGFEVTGHYPREVWRLEDKGIDPVYTQGFEARGYRSPANGNKIVLRAAGEPWLNDAY